MNECIKALIDVGYSPDEATGTCEEIYINLGPFNLALFVEDVILHKGVQRVDKV